MTSSFQSILENNKYLKEEWDIERKDFVEKMMKDLDRLKEEAKKDTKVLL